MNKLRERQAQFIILATGGPNKYEGKDMKEAHKGMGLGNMEFDTAWENLEKSCYEFGAKKDDVAEFKEIFYSVQGDVQEKK